MFLALNLDLEGVLFEMEEERSCVFNILWGINESAGNLVRKRTVDTLSRSRLELRSFDSVALSVRMCCRRAIMRFRLIDVRSRFLVTVDSRAMMVY